MKAVDAMKLTQERQFALKRYATLMINHLVSSLRVDLTGADTTENLLTLA